MHETLHKSPAKEYFTLLHGFIFIKAFFKNWNNKDFSQKKIVPNSERLTLYKYSKIYTMFSSGVCCAG